jgi:hypothetical protein
VSENVNKRLSVQFCRRRRHNTDHWGFRQPKSRNGFAHYRFDIYQGCFNIYDAAIDDRAHDLNRWWGASNHLFCGCPNCYDRPIYVPFAFPKCNKRGGAKDLPGILVEDPGLRCSYVYRDGCQNVLRKHFCSSVLLDVQPVGLNSPGVEDPVHEVSVCVCMRPASRLTTNFCYVGGTTFWWLSSCYCNHFIC